jgi:hypothetical protein
VANDGEDLASPLEAASVGFGTLNAFWVVVVWERKVAARPKQIGHRRAWNSGAEVGSGPAAQHVGAVWRPKLWKTSIEDGDEGATSRSCGAPVLAADRGGVGRAGKLARSEMPMRLY